MSGDFRATAAGVELLEWLEANADTPGPSTAWADDLVSNAAFGMIGGEVGL